MKVNECLWKSHISSAVKDSVMDESDMISLIFQLQSILTLHSEADYSLKMQTRQEDSLRRMGCIRESQKADETRRDN